MTLKLLLRSGGTGIVGAIVLVLITYAIAWLTNDPLLVTPPGGDTPQMIPVVAGAISSTIGGVFGIGIAFAASRSNSPRRLFLIICGVGLALFTISPFTQAEHFSTAIWLNVMHLAAAVPIVWSLANALPTTRTVS